ncbi:uncharacterized protein LOC124454700 [Xenia sp. Carnegie-2017]|uniref:uncharacterized protein LOC124454700 n=1 Tax=Xenia sp. Carnegie-2017 TaxID=2897299 RepID=UPI001F04278B|nr:uncharacterized protein LOC124454700 [Xenia sp. Carnegie-2017]
MMNATFWYDVIVPFGEINNPVSNKDMISEAFWNLKGKEFKLSRSDDVNHEALLQTTSNCLQGESFRSKLTSYGNWRNGKVWNSNACRGSCPVVYGGQYKTTAGFEQNNCSSNIQNRRYVGFWCDWSSGDGAVLMIGGGGSSCSRADHGIGITEENSARFGGTLPHYDFGKNADYIPPSHYSLNLWVR